MRLTLVAVLLAVIAGCSSTEQVGLMSRPTSNPGALIKEESSYTVIGPVEAKSCRYFLLAIIP